MNSRYQLNTLYVYLTRDCNLHCKHCWQSAGEGAFEDRLFQQPDILIKTLYQAKKIGLRLLKISGGEPFLKRELLNMILSFSEKNNVDSVIETNGTLINEQDLPMLKAANALVGVSLDYLDNKKMDAFREGRGLLKKVSNAIKMLVNAGIEVQVIMALTRENVSIIEDMVGFCKAEGVSDLKINPVSPSGRAKKMLESQIILDPEYLLNLSKTVSEIQARHAYSITLEVPPAFRNIVEYHCSRTGGRCNILNLLGILSDGSISICAVGYESKSFILGNIFDGSDILELWKGNPFLMSIRKDLPDGLDGICKDCIFKRACLGGCRARLIESGRSFYDSYPLCAELHKKQLFPKQYMISFLKREVMNNGRKKMGETKCDHN